MRKMNDQEAPSLAAASEGSKLSNSGPESHPDTSDSIYSRFVRGLNMQIGVY